MSKKKSIGIAALSLISAVCLTVGLVTYFSQSPAEVLAATVNSVTRTVSTDEDDFTYAKSGDYVYITGLTDKFKNDYSGKNSNVNDTFVTYNIRLVIPDTLENAHGDIPSGSKVAYVQEGAFADDYITDGGKITFRITDVYTPQTVFWQAKKTSEGGLFKLANFDKGSAPIENRSVFDDSKDATDMATWAWMLGSNDGVTATVYDINDSLPQNFIVPSPMWFDNDSDGKMDENELFTNVELLVNENPTSAADKGGKLNNMVISSGVTRFFNPYVRSSTAGASGNRIRIEDAFRTSASNAAPLTGIHFATGRTTVLPVYGITFQRYTDLQTITLSSGVLLADGFRAFQQDNNVESVYIPKESNSNVPSFYIRGDQGAIYTNDYRYSYYTTAGYRKWLVWDYVTRTGKRLGDEAFWNNVENNGDYNSQVDNEDCLVTFDLNYDNAPQEDIPTSQTVPKHEKVIQPDKTPTRDDYIFSGWYTSASGGTLWNFSDDVVTGPMTLFAHWTVDLKLSDGVFENYGTSGSGWFADNLGYNVPDTSMSSTTISGNYYKIVVPSDRYQTDAGSLTVGSSEVSFTGRFNCNTGNNFEFTPKVDMYFGIYANQSSSRYIQMHTESVKGTVVAKMTTGNKFDYFYDADGSSLYLFKANQTYYFDGNGGSCYLFGFLAQPVLADGNRIPDGASLYYTYLNSSFGVRSGTVAAGTEIASGDWGSAALVGTHTVRNSNSLEFAGGTAGTNGIKFVLDKKSSITAFAGRASDRSLQLYKYDSDTIGDTVGEAVLVGANESDFKRCEMGVTEGGDGFLDAGTYYLASTGSSINISQILITVAPEASSVSLQPRGRLIGGIEGPVPTGFVGGQLIGAPESAISPLSLSADDYEIPEDSAILDAGELDFKGNFNIQNVTSNITAATTKQVKYGAGTVTFNFGKTVEVETNKQTIGSSTLTGDFYLKDSGDRTIGFTLSTDAYVTVFASIKKNDSDANGTLTIKKSSSSITQGTLGPMNATVSAPTIDKYRLTSGTYTFGYTGTAGGSKADNYVIYAIIVSPVGGISADVEEVVVDASDETGTTFNVTGHGDAVEHLKTPEDISTQFKTTSSKFTAEVGTYSEDSGLPITVKSNGAAAGETDTLTVTLSIGSSSSYKLTVDVRAVDSAEPASIEITSDDGIFSGEEAEWDGVSSYNFTAEVYNALGATIDGFGYDSISWITDGNSVSAGTGKTFEFTPEKYGKVTITARLSETEVPDATFTLILVKPDSPVSIESVNGKTEDVFLYEDTGENTYSLQAVLTWKDGAVEGYSGVEWSVEDANDGASMSGGKTANETLTVTDGTQRDITVTATVTLRSGEEASKSLTIHIYNADTPARIEIAGDDIYYFDHTVAADEAEEHTLTAQIYNYKDVLIEDYSGDVTWSLDGESIVGIDGENTGMTVTLKATGTAYGKVTVTAKISESISAQMELEVVDPDRPSALSLSKTVTSVEVGRQAEIAATLTFPYDISEEKIAEVFSNLKWTLLDGGSSYSGSMISISHSVIGAADVVILTVTADPLFTEAKTYTLKAELTYTDVVEISLSAQCLVTVVPTGRAVEDIDPPEVVTDQFVAYQKLLYVPPQLKDSSGNLLEEFTFQYTATTIIGNSAFTASKIKVVDIPDRISEIEEYAFRYSDVTTVYLPSTAVYGNAVFGEFKDFKVGGDENANNVKLDKTDGVFRTAYKNLDFLLIAPSYQTYDNLLKIKSGNQADGEVGDMFNRGEATFSGSISDAGGIVGITYDYRSKLTYEVEIVFRATVGEDTKETSVIVLYNQMDGDNLYVKDVENGKGYVKKTWDEILSGVKTALGLSADSEWYYGPTQITSKTAESNSDYEDLLTGNAEGVTYILAKSDLQDVMTSGGASGNITYSSYKVETKPETPLAGEHTSSGIYTNSDTIDVDTWETGKTRKSVLEHKADYVQNGRRLPASITLTAESSSEQINSAAIAVPGFQSIGTRVPDGENQYPEITVTFDFSGFPYDRFLSGYNENIMTATYTYQKYEGGALVAEGVKGGEAGDNADNIKFGYPYAAGRYVVALNLDNPYSSEDNTDGNVWSGVYNGLPVNEAQQSGTFNFVLNILKRDVRIPGEQQVYHIESTGAEINIFENNAFYDVVKYSEKITVDGDGTESVIGDMAVLDSENEIKPSQRGSYWVALKLVDEYNLQWVGEGNAVIDRESAADGEFFSRIGANVCGQPQDSTFITCKLIITDNPEISLPHWTTDGLIGTYSGSTFTARYREQGYTMSDIFAGYSEHSMNLAVMEFVKRGNEEPEKVTPNSILNAGTYSITFEPAENYSWLRGSSGCGYTVTATGTADSYEVTVVINAKILETPPSQTQFLPSEQESGVFEYIAASDGTWTVAADGYKKSDETVDKYAPRTIFTEGVYSVKVRLTDSANYAWRMPMDGNPEYAEATLNIRSLDSLGLKNPVRRPNVPDPDYAEGETVSSSTYIEYDALITRDYREVYSYTYDSYTLSPDGSETYARKTADVGESPAINAAGDYVIRFSLPSPIGGNNYWWTEDGTTSYGGEDDSGNPDVPEQQKYYGKRYVSLTVNKIAVPNEKAAKSDEVLRLELPENGSVRLSAEYSSDLYTITYKANDASGGLNSRGLPNKVGSYTAILRLTPEAYKSYYFKNTSKTVSGEDGEFYPASIEISINVVEKVTEVPYVNKPLTYNGTAINLDDIITNVSPNEMSEPVMLQYERFDGTTTEGTEVSVIRDAGKYTVQYTLTSVGSKWYTTIPAAYRSYNDIKVDDDNPNILYVVVTVERAALTVSGIAVDSKTYDQTAEATVSASGTLGGEIYSVDGVKDEVSIGSVTAAFKDADAEKGKTVDIEIVLSGARSFNYVAEEESEITADIDAAEISVDFTGESTATYDTEDHFTEIEALDFSAESSLTKDSDYTLTVSFMKRNGSSSENTDEAVHAGTYTATVSLTNTNYVFAENERTHALTYTINPQTVTVAYGQSGDKVSYDGTDHIDDAKAVHFNGWLENGNTPRPEDYTVTVKKDGEESEQVVVAGSYTATVGIANADYAFADGASYKDSFDLSFEVEKAEIGSIDWSLDGTTAKSYQKDYDGQEHTVTAKGSAHGSEVELQVSDGGTFKNYKDGGYTFTASLTDDNNYKFSDSLTSETSRQFKATVNRKNLTVDPGNSEYSGEPQKSTALDQIAGVAEESLTLNTDYSVTYSVSSSGGGNMDEGTSLPLGAGRYDVVISPMGTSDLVKNYTFTVSDTFDIARAQITVVYTQGDAVVYDGATHEVADDDIHVTHKDTEMSADEKEGLYELTYFVKESGNGYLVSSLPYGAGVYTVNLELVNNNYQIQSQTINDFTIGKATITLQGQYSKSVQYDDESGRSGTIGLNTAGKQTLSTSVSADDQYISVTYSISSPVSIGTYSYASEEKPVTLTVTIKSGDGGRNIRNNYEVDSGENFKFTAGEGFSFEIIVEKAVIDSVTFYVGDAKYSTAEEVTANAERMNSAAYTFEYDGTVHYVYAVGTTQDGENEVLLSASGNQVAEIGSASVRDVSVSGGRVSAYSFNATLPEELDGEYTLSAASALSVTVTPKVVSVVFNGQREMTYNGQDRRDDITSVTVMDGETEVENSVTVSKGSQSAEEVKDVGTYTVRVTLTNTNYAVSYGASYSMTSSQNFEIKQAAINLTIELEAIYSAEEVDLSREGSFDSVSITLTAETEVSSEVLEAFGVFSNFALSKGSVQIKDAKTYTIGLDGSDIIVALSNSDGNYTLNSVTRGSLVINPKEITAKFVGGKDSVVYDGSSHKTDAENVTLEGWLDGVAQGQGVDFTASVRESEVKSCGTYHVTVTLNNDNYKFADGKSQELTFTIQQAEITAVKWKVDGVDADPEYTYVYDGTAHTVTAYAQWSGEEFALKVTLDGEETAQFKDVKVEGYEFEATLENTADFRFSPSVSLDTSVLQTFTVTPAAITSLKWYDGEETAQNFTYDGKTHIITVKGVWSEGELALNISVNSEPQSSQATIRNAATYTFTASLTQADSESGNYTFTLGAEEKQIIISKKTVTVSGITATKKYDNSTDAELDVSKAAFAGLCSDDGEIPDEVTLESAEGNYSDKNVGTRDLEITSVVLTGEDSSNYQVTTPFTLESAGTIEKTKIEVSGELDLSDILEGSDDLSAALKRYLTYNKAEHKTIAITNSPLTAVPKTVADDDNTMGSGYLDEKGGVGYGGSFPYFYLPMTDAMLDSQYGLTIKNFYGIGSNADGAILTLMFVTNSGNAGDYIFRQSGSALLAEANIADTSLNDSKLNYDGQTGSGSWGEEGANWTYADFAKLTAAQLTVTPAQVELHWAHTVDGEDIPLETAVDNEHSYNGVDRFGEYKAYFTSVRTGDKIEYTKASRGLEITSYTDMSSHASAATEVKNAGEYKIDITASHPNYTFSGAEQLTVNINRYTITDEDIAALATGWVNTANGNPLASGTYDVGAEGATSQKSGVNAFAMIKEDKTAEVELDTHQFFGLPEGDGREAAFRAEYTGNTQQDGIYEYTAVARLQFTNFNNYEWKDSYTVANNTAAVEKDSGKNDLVLTKTWYLVKSINGITANLLVNGEELKAGADWIFNQDTVTITEPVLQHSEAEDNSYYTLRFSPYSWEHINYNDGSIADYLNKSAPFGMYTLTLHVASWTDGGETVYPEETFDFTVIVGRATFAPQHDLSGNSYSAAYNGERQLPTEVDNIEYSVTVSRTGEWANETYNGLYGEPTLQFSNDRTQAYGSKETYLSSGAPQNVKLKNEDYGSDDAYKLVADAYTVYYRISAPNYNNYVSSFSFTITQVELTVDFKVASPVFKDEDGVIYWAYGSSVNRSNLTVDFGEQILGGDDVLLRYNYYVLQGEEYVDTHISGSMHSDAAYPREVGKYKVRLTFDLWNSDENQNNNYNLSGYDGVLFETKDGTKYAKPYVEFDIEIRKADVDISGGIGEMREATYTGSAQNYLKGTETGRFSETHADGRIVNVKKAEGVVTYYVVYISIIDSEHYAWPSSLQEQVGVDNRLEVHLKINPAEITSVTWKVTEKSEETPQSSYVYDGKEHTVTAEGTWTGGIVQLCDSTFKDVRTYSFSAVIDSDNFVYSASVSESDKSRSIEVTAFEITEETVKSAVSINGKIYDGETAANYSLDNGKINGAADEKPQIEVVSAVFNSANVADADSVTVTVRLSDEWKTNYALESSEFTVTASISKATITVGGSYSAEHTYNGSAFSAEISSGAAPETLTITVNNEKAVPSFTITVSTGAGVIVGTYTKVGGNLTVTENISEISANYDIQNNASYTVQIVQAEWDMSSFQTSRTRVYNGKVQTYLEEGEDSDYTEDDNGVEFKNAQNSAYTAYISLKDTNYKWPSSSSTDRSGRLIVSLTITRAKVSASIDSEFTYNGKDQKDSLKPAVQFANLDASTATPESSAYTVALVENTEFKNAGQYRLTVTLTSVNFTFDGDGVVTKAELSVDMDRATLSESEVKWTVGRAGMSGSAASESYTYDGYEYTVSAKVDWSDGDETVHTFEMTISDSNTFKDNGSYTFNASYSDPNFNDFNVSKTITVAKRTLAASDLTVQYGQSATYDSKEHEIVYSYNEQYISAENITVTYDDREDLPVNAKQYTVKITVSGDNFVSSLERTVYFTINRVQLNASALEGVITSSGKVYDGTTDAKSTLNTTSGNLNGVMLDGGSYEQVGYTVKSAVYNNENVNFATSITVTIELTDSDGNYELAHNGDTLVINGSITAKGLNAEDIIVSAVTKEYDGTADALSAIGTLTGELDGVLLEEVGYRIVSASYDSKDVDATSVTVVIELTDVSGNYTLVNSEKEIESCTINPKTLLSAALKSSITSDGKEYDGTNAALATLNNSTGHIDGVIVEEAAEQVGYSVTSATFTNVNVGNGRIINIVVSLDSENYVLDDDTWTVNGDITPRTISAEDIGITSNGKEYDGTVEASATLVKPEYRGVLDEVINYTVTAAEFNSADVASATSITVTIELARGITNYALDEGEFVISGTISPKELDIGAIEGLQVEQAKTYDRTASARILSNGSLAGVGSESVAFTASASYDTAAVGTGKTITVTVTLNNTNYVLNSDTYTIASASITPALVELAATQTTFTYDGTAHSVNVELNCDVELTAADYTTDGETSAVNAGEYSVTYTLSDNFTFASGKTSTVEYTVEKANVVLNVPDNQYVTYDGSAHGIAPVTAESWVSGITVTYNGSETQPVNAGEYEVVVSVEGTSNYNGATVTVTFSINKKSVTVNWGESLSFTADGFAKTPYLGLNGAPENTAVVTYSADGSTIEGVPSAEGTYTVTVTLNSDNYLLEGATSKTYRIESSVQPPETDSDGTATEAEEFNWDGVWVGMIALSSLSVAFAVVSAVIFVKKKR